MNVLNTLNFPKAVHDLVPNMLNGLWVVFEVTIFAFLIALIIGILIAMGRLSKFKWLRFVLVVLLELIRGTPLLVQLIFIYYVVPLLIMIAVQFFIPEFRMEFNPVLAGIIGLALNYSVYLSEVVRAGVLSIDQGQKEAALSLGFTTRQAYYQVVLPQALRAAIPVFGNYLVMMIKDTSLLSLITVSEITLRAETYASQSFLTIESYSILALTYFIISFPLAKLVRIIEKRMSFE